MIKLVLYCIGNIIINLTQFERVNSELKQRRYDFFFEVLGNYLYSKSIFYIHFMNSWEFWTAGTIS
jgi:hypothetical protein